MQNRNLTPVDLLWVMFIYLTITDFNWWFLSLSVILCPLWAEIYYTAKIKQEATKRNKVTIEQFKNDLENEKEN